MTEDQRRPRRRDPAELEARVEILEADVREQWEAIGYEVGLTTVRAEGPGLSGPLD